MEEEKKKIERTTDYQINRLKKVGDLNYNETFLHYKLSPMLNFFDELKTKTNQDNYVELKSSILSNSFFEIIQCEESSIFLAYNGFYNPAVSLLRNCLDIFLTHLYFYLESEENLYLNGTLNKENNIFLKWKSGEGQYPNTEKIYAKLNEQNRDEIITEEIKIFYQKLSKFVHGRENINKNGRKIGYLTNYFYSGDNMDKYKEFHEKLFRTIKNLFEVFCKNNIKN